MGGILEGLAVKCPAHTYYPLAGLEDGAAGLYNPVSVCRYICVTWYVPAGIPPAVISTFGAPGIGNLKGHNFPLFIQQASLAPAKKVLSPDGVDAQKYSLSCRPLVSNHAVSGFAPSLH